MCFKKGCESYRKSIRCETIEGEFNSLLKNLSPTKGNIALFNAIFSKLWDMQAKQVNTMKAQLERKITDTGSEVNQLLKRIVSASNESVIAANEGEIEKLERDKLVWAEKAQNITRQKSTFSEMFELAINFLANPQNLWKNGQLAGRKTLLRLAFSGPLTYKRNEGFRAPEVSSIFKALEGFFQRKF